MALKDFFVIFVSMFFDILSMAILVRVILSWVRVGGAAGLGRLRSILYDVTEPVLGFFSKIVPRVGMFDFSPIIALLALDLARSLVITFLKSAF